MKNFNLLFTMLLMFTISCNSSNSKQALSTENIPENTIATENKGLQEDKNNEDDSIVFVDSKDVASHPQKEDVIKYFRQNNKFKDWNASEKKKALVSYSTLKDGTNTDVKIKISTDVQKLDDEAIRLIKELKYDNPAYDYGNNPVNVKNMVILVYFPPQ